MQNQNITCLDKLTNWLLALILVIPFLISFGALADLAAKNDVSCPWLYPIMIDGGLIIFKAIALRASLRGKRDNYAWAWRLPPPPSASASTLSTSPPPSRSWGWRPSCPPCHRWSSWPPSSPSVSGWKRARSGKRPSAPGAGWPRWRWR